MVWPLFDRLFGSDETESLAWKNRAKGWSSHVKDAEAFAKTTVTGPLDSDIAFVHVPKCAGIAVDSAIRRAYRSVWTYEGHGIRRLHPGAADEVGDLYGRSNWSVRETVVAYHLARPRTRYVSGHFQVTSKLLERFGDDYAFVTLLRHPVDRWISHFLYNKYTPTDHRYHIHDDVETFLETERAKGIGQIFLAYFTGTGDVAPEERAQSGEILEAARANLQKFDLIGFVEEMGQFGDQFERRFGAPLDLVRRNENPAGEEERDFSPEEIERIEEHCAADLELYHLAREQFGAR